MSDGRIPPWAVDLARDVTRLEERVDELARWRAQADERDRQRDQDAAAARVEAATVGTRQGVLWQAIGAVVAIVAGALITLAITRLSAPAPASAPAPMQGKQAPEEPAP